MLYSVVMIFAIHQHELATGIHVSPASWASLWPPSPLYPSGLSQTTGSGYLLHVSIFHWPSVLHIVIYMFPLLFSQFIPPSPSPTVSTSLSSMSASPLLVGYLWVILHLPQLEIAPFPSPVQIQPDSLALQAFWLNGSAGYGMTSSRMSCLITTNCAYIDTVLSPILSSVSGKQ